MVVNEAEYLKLKNHMPDQCPKPNCLFVYNKRYCYPCSTITQYIDEQTKTHKTRSIITQIQNAKPYLTTEAIKALTIDENKKYANLLKEETALIFVANQLGITITL